MAGLPDEQRVLAEIEQHLIQEDPRLAARMESYSDRLGGGRARRRGSMRSRRSVVIVTICWLLIATFVATLLLLALLHPAAALRP